MIKLFNKEHKAISVLTDVKDHYVEYELSGENLTGFSLLMSDKNIKDIETEGYIQDKENEYVLKSIDPSGDYTTIKAVVNLETIKGKSIPLFELTNTNIGDTIQTAIAGTGWLLNDHSITKRRTIRLKNTNALEVLREIAKVFRVEYKFDAINKTITVSEKLGEDKGAYFTEELNLISMYNPTSSNDYVTKLICVGKEGLTFADINNGKDYVENYQYSNKVLELIWSDERYTDKQSLLDDAKTKLEELSKPKKSYEITVVDLASRSSDYSYLDFSLGDTVTLLSNQHKFRDKLRVIKYIKYPEEPHRNTVELGNRLITFEDLQQENDYKNQVVDNITSDNGTIKEDAVPGISTEKIYDFDVNVGRVVNLTAINADITNLKAQNVTISGNLTAITADIGKINVNVGNIDKLVVGNIAEINNLKSLKADIVDLNATNATIGTIEAEVGKIKTLVAGNISGENIQAGGITSDKLTISNGFITNAMIANLDVSKVNAGTITTEKFKIKSNDGALEFIGSTQQFKDSNGRVRIQIGKDAQGNFNFIIRGEDGTTTLIDHTGVKAKAIADDLIVSNMISNDAVGEKQINYSSFATGFNKDTNTNTIKSTKVHLNNQNQTLEVAFNSLKTQADGTKSTTESNSTSISVMQGQITTAINNTQITKDGQTILLKDDYNRTVQTVNSMNSTLGSHTTKIDANTGKITGVESKVNIVERDLNSITQRVSSTETNVTTITSTANNALNKIDGLQIGGNNLLYTTSKDFKEFTMTVWNYLNYTYTLEELGLKVGDDITHGLYLKFGNVPCGGSSRITFYDSANTNIKSVHNPTFILKNSEGYSFVTTQIPNNAVKVSVGVQREIAGESQQEFKFHMKKQKLEKGNKFTDWSPNPKDLENYADGKANDALNNAKTYVNGEITTVNNNVAEIKATTDGITQSVASLQSTTTVLRTDVNLANSNANKGIADAKGALDKANSANTKIDGLEIGISNLILNSAPYTTGWSWAGIAGTASLVDEPTAPRGKAMKATFTSNGSSGGLHKTPKKVLTPGNKYSWSVWVKASKNMVINIGAEQGGRIDCNITTEWKKFTHTFTATDYQYKSFVFYAKTIVVNDAYYVHSLKLEEGTKPTDYTEAPEDVSNYADGKANDALNNAKTYVNAEITTVNGKVAEIKTDVNGINSKVSTVEKKTTALEKITEKMFINNFSRTGNVERWSGVSQQSSIKDSNTVGKYLDLVSTGNDVQVISEGFEIDPNMSLKISLMLQNKDANGSWYFGIHAYDKDWNNIGVYINTSTSLNTNPYFINEGNTAGNSNWRTFEGYVYGHQTVVDNNTPKGSVNNFFKLHSNTKYLKIRFLNFRSSPNYGNGATGSVYYAHPTIYTIDSQIANTETRLKTAESKITDTAIKNVVRSEFATNSSVSGQISTVNQTINGLEIKVEKYGASNLVRNSNPKPKNTSGWSTEGSVGFYLGNPDMLGLHNNTQGEGYLWSDYFEVQGGGDWYSFQCKVMKESNVSSGDIFVIAYEKKGNSWVWAENIAPVFANGDWVNYKATHYFPSNVKYARFRIDNNGAKAGANGNYVVVWMKEAFACKGKAHYPQWSLNPNEVNVGITNVDIEGIKVSHEQGSFTRMNYKEFYQANENGDRTISMRFGGLRQYAFNQNGHNASHYLGSLSAVVSNNLYGTMLFGSNGSGFVDIGFSESGNDDQHSSITPWLSCIHYGGNKGLEQGVHIAKELYARNYAKFMYRTKFENGIEFPYANGQGDNSEVSWISVNTGSTPGNRHLWLAGADIVNLSVQNGGIFTGHKMIEDQSGAKLYHTCWGQWNMNGWAITNTSIRSILSDPTRNIDERYHNSRESQQVMSTKKIIQDRGESFTTQLDTVIRNVKKINKHKIIIEEEVIEESLFESIIEIPNDIKYHIDKYDVDIIKYGRGDIWVAERHQDYFVVKSEQEINFTWVLEGELKENYARAYSNYDTTAFEPPANNDFIEDVEPAILSSKFGAMDDEEIEKELELDELRRERATQRVS